MLLRIPSRYLIHHRRVLTHLNDYYSETFGFRQIIVAGTANDKVFGIDSSNGEIVWSRVFFLTSTFDTDTCKIVLSAYFFAVAALKAREIDVSIPRQDKNRHFLPLFCPKRLPFLLCLVVREQTRFTLTNSKISTLEEG